MTKSRSEEIIVFPEAKALIFDCDGTLVDSMPLHYKVYQQLFEEYGYKFPLGPFEFGGMNAVEIVKLAQNILGCILPVAEIVTKKRQLTHQLLRQYLQPIDKIVAFAQQYQGKLPMAVVSGSSRANVEVSLRTINMFESFDVVLTGEDNLPSKPCPDCYLEAAKRLGVEPRYCQVFEDSAPGLEGARRAGMMVTDVNEYL